MSKPGLPTVKKLFALSCNVCAFPSCEVRLTDPQWNRVNGEICHIAGDRPGAARYDPTMTDQERADFENLILLCPNHHREIDDLRPQDHTRDSLTEMKELALRRCENREWTTEVKLHEIAIDALTRLVEATALQPAQQTTPQSTRPAERAKLTLQLEDDRLTVRNNGDGDALDVRISLDEDAPLILQNSTFSALSPGATARVGLHTPTFANSGTFDVVVDWQDEDGSARHGTFPIG